jgi:hypothetical protein
MVVRVLYALGRPPVPGFGPRLRRAGRNNARDTWLTVTLAIPELENLLTILRKRLP